MSTQDLVNEWKKNPQLHTQLQASFQNDPEAVCIKYGITGQEKIDLIEAAKKGGDELEKRINLLSIGSSSSVKETIKDK